jgi:hypothetical protein
VRRITGRPILVHFFSVPSPAILNRLWATQLFLGSALTYAAAVTYEERLRQERGSGNMDAVQRWYTRPITEQSQYEFDDL